MVIFYSYVKWPEGTFHSWVLPGLKYTSPVRAVNRFASAREVSTFSTMAAVRQYFLRLTEKREASGTAGTTNAKSVFISLSLSLSLHRHLKRSAVFSILSIYLSIYLSIHLLIYFFIVIILLSWFKTYIYKYICIYIYKDIDISHRHQLSVCPSDMYTWL